MEIKCYIQASAAISPQQSFSGEYAPQFLPLEERNLLRAQEPGYAGFIPPNSLRRMSRLLKMGLTAALQCLRNANATVPGAIITGTGRGSLQDTEKFLHDIRTYEETALNPTPFIQSTYNSVNGLIALQQQCTDYNNTFVHRGFSFEHALLDSLLQIQEGNAESVLVGGFDEMTVEHFFIKSRIGYWKSALTQPADMLASGTPGTIAGEGAVFFLVGTQPAPVEVRGIQMLYRPAPDQVASQLAQFLQKQGVKAEDVDLLVIGRNGDTRFDHFYAVVEKALPSTATNIPFKQYCGEYDTAGAFGMWTAQQELLSGRHKTALVYNHFYGEQHTFILLQKH
ncbi:beta-ketoacyl synthase chain length factor [Chitinophaga rhizosphaerae]|uniref:beta-ketoacyl synthase chain length factor n=1 Tax=Chitinophaga rhizosphaerae TaxID=1864947 RepID=UPI000F80E624|nr:beta-ketoacyl synthase chain length factor [Chitinophaga rhizosphaerae]